MTGSQAFNEQPATTVLQAITRVIEAQDQLVESAKLGTSATPPAKA